jgi:hypothetical protein
MTCKICGKPSNGSYCSDHIRQGLPPGYIKEITNVSGKFILRRFYLNRMSRKNLIKLIEENLEPTQVKGNSNKVSLRKYVMCKNSRITNFRKI